MPVHSGLGRSSMQAVQAMEERSWSAWPASATQSVGDWLLRLSGGYTKRANSVNAQRPGAQLAGLLSTIESVYAQYGLPCIFRLSALAAPEADAVLHSAGYSFSDPSLVMGAPMSDIIAPQPGAIPAGAQVVLAGSPTPAWLAGVARLNALAPHEQQQHTRMLQAIVAPCAYACLYWHGEPVAYGLAVLEHGGVGFYDIMVAPAQQGQGHGRAIMHALLDWARSRGALWADLQVRAPNLVARRLYAGLGLREQYSYHYRLPEPGVKTV